MLLKQVKHTSDEKLNVSQMHSMLYSQQQCFTENETVLSLLNAPQHIHPIIRAIHESKTKVCDYLHYGVQITIIIRSYFIR